MELEDYQDALEFHPEDPLTSKPLQIDCVVIKKIKDIPIKKNIAVIFREWNLLEYKSPRDYVSVDDFYKVYGCACLYASLKKVPITGLTVTFVESRNPRKLLGHLRRERAYDVAETSPGIYTVSGDILPIQIVDSRKLPMEENLWLKGLSNKLDQLTFRKVSAEIRRRGKAARIGAYMEAMTRANSMTTKEEIEMGRAPTLEEIFEEVGWITKWKTEGEQHKAHDIAQNMVKLGLPFETVVSATGLDPVKVKELYDQ